MTEKVEEQPKLTAKFIKLNNGEDIVAYVLEENDKFIRIQKPMEVHIDNDLPTARQMLNVREWIPPLIVKTDTVDLPMDYVLLVMELTEHFHTEFGDIVSYFYSVTPRDKKKPSKKDAKVVSISDIFGKNKGGGGSVH